MTLRGYRSSDRALLSGPWPPGELLGIPLPAWPALAPPTTVEPPSDTRTELCVLPGAGFVRYTEIDWVNRRARVELGLLPDAGATRGALEPLVAAAVAHGFHRLHLHRLHGWVSPVTEPPTAVLESAGFLREATVPSALWLDGRSVEREIWGVVRDG
jgi:hypothetical protein